MNKEIKTINEIIVAHINLNGFYNLESKLAFTLYNAGYSRREDVAREIFAEIEEHFKAYEYFVEYSYDDLVIDIAELKKKYGVKEE